ncbi:P-loop NTPase fold protein [Metasolibacillus sp.]|uniref:P-loop NTPase fold protein n=1 Tax=Metasolibacillus sp. TaxID=2703680 RepID=UPI0025F31965|nr:P-loop NTPase fold protein [Metasolibacillus sp.]MCT6925905.1 KAP family NTPase [Metasolibacillus sp.]MCT6942061.1 KAP family NTPase [Metasolibacillus sp.]
MTYDLLNRSSVINLLYDTIQNCNPNEGFVISLEGSWGSGKTTIISNVKRMLKTNEGIIIIDELDPWSYANQESLFYSMFDTIIQKSGIKFNSLLTKQMADSIYSSLFGSKKTNMIKSFLKPIDTIDVLKNRINDYLKFSGKKVIFFIDNIDRAESENIVLLFKLIGNVFDFERVIYILSFDNKQVKNAFENNLSIDYQYLKKIIQMQIFVPEVDRSVLEGTMSRCLNNILIAYGEDLSKLSNYHSFIRAICKLTEDFRDFKRYINSVLNTHVNNMNYLDTRDFLSIEYIRLNNIQLYNTIYKNRKYFISHDQMVDKEVYRSVIDRATFNISGNQFFETLFEDQNNAKYLDLLQEIFPYVKRYHTNQQLEYDGNVILRDDSYQEISKNNRICSGKYFDLYFTKTGNEYLEVGNRVGQFVKRINNIQDSEAPAQILKDLLASMPDYYQKEFFERLQLYIDDLQNESIYELTIALFKSINDIDNTRGFFSLSARSRVEIIIWGLLQMINEEQYKEFLEKIKSDYDKVQNISSLLYWFKHDKEGKNITGRMEEMEKLYKEMCASIIEDSIDLYDDEYYNKGNIWGLVRCYEEDLSIIKNYIKDVINKDNIFRLLYDIIGVSQGSELRYSISNENLCYFTTKDDIDEILKDVENVTDDQEFILQVYNNYKNDSRDDWGETGIVSNKILDLKP